MSKGCGHNISVRIWRRERDVCETALTTPGFFPCQTATALAISFHIPRNALFLTTPIAREKATTPIKLDRICLWNILTSFSIANILQYNAKVDSNKHFKFLYQRL